MSETPTDGAAEPRPADIVRTTILRNQKANAGYFVDRDDVLQSLDIAALTRHHCLLVGPPGTAKSQMARAWSSQFTDAVYREALLTRQTTEDQVLCYLDVPAYMQGTRQYKFDGGLPEGQVIFVDECFKATGGLLNAFLGLLNERIVRGFKSPLISAIGASNEFGEDDSVAALEDRFLLRHMVGYIDKESAKIEFLRARAQRRPVPTLEAVTLAELETCQAAVAAMPIDEAIFALLSKLQINLNGIGVQVSDRRLGQCLVILQAYAWLQGDTSVGPEHVDVLRHVLWRRPEEKGGVDAAIGAIDKGLIGEIRAIVERVLEPFHTARMALDANGVWTSEAARRAYIEKCPAFLIDFQRAAEEIKSKFGGNVPERVKTRAKEYLEELKSSFVQARQDSKLAL